MKICFATGNKHKLSELNSLLGSSYEVLGLHDIGCLEDLKEEKDTIEGNSDQKAKYVAETYKIDCFADDTGLIVNALNGEPGVYSARYAGLSCNAEDNMNLLLKNLQIDTVLS